MSKPLTPAKRKKILAAWIECQNYSEVSRVHKVSIQGVKNVVLQAQKENPNFAEELKQKRQEESQNVLEWYAKQSESKIELINNLLVGMNSKAAAPDMFTSLVDMAKTLGIMLDKEYKGLELQIQNAGSARTEETDALSEALENIGKTLDKEKDV